jgi:hypothetical protein
MIDCVPHRINNLSPRRGSVVPWRWKREGRRVRIQRRCAVQAFVSDILLRAARRQFEPMRTSRSLEDVAIPAAPGVFHRGEARASLWHRHAGRLRGTTWRCGSSPWLPLGPGRARLLRLHSKAGAVNLFPIHPLLDATIDLTLKRNREPRRGAIYLISSCASMTAVGRTIRSISSLRSRARRATTQIKVETMRTLWVPGVNNLRSYGRWSFIEFSDAFAIEEEFAKLIQQVRSKAGKLEIS